jgi:hypothetical protein
MGLILNKIISFQFFFAKLTREASHPQAPPFQGGERMTNNGMIHFSNDDRKLTIRTLRN